MSQEINLLPPAMRLARTRRLYFENIGGVLRRLYVLLFFIVVVQGVALAAYIFILSDLKASVEQRVSTDRNVAKETRDLNVLIDEFRERADALVSYTTRLNDVFAAIDGSLVLTDLEVVADEDSRDAEEESLPLRVAGTTSSRTDVTTLKDALEKLSWVERVEAPLENFTVGATTEFVLLIYSR